LLSGPVLALTLAWGALGRLAAARQDAVGIGRPSLRLGAGGRTAKPRAFSGPGQHRAVTRSGKFLRAQSLGAAKKFNVAVFMAV